MCGSTGELFDCCNGARTCPADGCIHAWNTEEEVEFGPEVGEAMICWLLRVG